MGTNAPDAGHHGRDDEGTGQLLTRLEELQSYFGYCETPSVLRGLDQWIRRRLRSVIWKHWKRGSVRFARLRQRHIGTDLAAQTAGSPHGTWWLANSPALSIAFPTAYFDGLGLP